MGHAKFFADLVQQGAVEADLDGEGPPACIPDDKSLLTSARRSMFVFVHVPQRSYWLYLALAGALVSPSAGAAPAPGEPAPETRPGRPLRIGGAVSMGVGALLLMPMALGITEYFRATSSIKRQNELALAEDRRFTKREFASVEDTYHHSQGMKALAISTGVLGGALVATGLALFLVGARASRDAVSSSRAVRVLPIFSPSQAGLSISARF